MRIGSFLYFGKFFFSVQNKFVIFSGHIQVLLLC